MSGIHTSKADRLYFAVNMAILLFVLAVILYPMWYVLIVSLSDGTAVLHGRVKWLPVNFTLATYREVFSNPDILNSYKNTLVYTSLGTAINLTMTTLCAYPLSKKAFYGRNGFAVMIVITMFFSGGLIPSYLLLMNLKFIDTIWAMVLPGAIASWNMIIMRTFFQNLPVALFESAEIDGANDIRQLISVALPLSLPILATMAIFYAVGHWNSYFSAMIYLNSKSKYPLQIILRNIVLSNDTSSQPGNENYSSLNMRVISTTIKYAVIVVAAAPILTIYPLFQRHFVKGVTVGALKG